jgi:hypothetical protein
MPCQPEPSNSGSSTPLFPISTPIDFFVFAPNNNLNTIEGMLLWPVAKSGPMPRSSA